MQPAVIPFNPTLPPAALPCLPCPALQAQVDLTTTDGRIALLANQGHLATARDNVRMCALLDSVKVGAGLFCVRASFV